MRLLLTRELTAEHLRQLLDYDPLTGAFIWRVRPITTNYDRCWNGRWAGKLVGCGKEGYLRVELFDVPHYLHRLAWLHFYGEWPVRQIDHCNGDRADNRIANLRLATHHENCWNAKRSNTNTSGIKGVSYYRRKRKWQGKVWAFGKQHHVGYFRSKEEAEQAVMAFRERNHGTFARHA